LTFQDLIAANLSRVARWHPEGLSEWSPLEWAGAMAGEAGEACNAAKKLKRIDSQIANINHEAGRSLTERETACRQIAKEVADTIIYGALLVSAVGQDLAVTVAEVFNKKSKEYGFPEHLPLPTALVPPRDERLTAAEAYLVMLQRELRAASEEQTRIVIKLGKLREQLIQAGDSPYVSPPDPTVLGVPRETEWEHMPQRIQRKRTKGWRMPNGAIYVGRGTQWGNPFRVDPLGIDPLTREQAIARYRYEIVQMNGGVVGFNRFWVQQKLRGKDLACWCPLAQPCHADVLLELASG
jgi:NTP pyrophosphatase (non-canonical NTP hydrolase)